MGQMDVVINFWDNVANKVCTHYLHSTAICHARQEDLFKHFISALDSLDLKKLLHVSMDGPNVNWAFSSELPNYWIEMRSKLLSTGSCSLHAINGAFKTGEQSTDWKLFRGLHQILHDTPARQNDYADKTKRTQFPLPFYGTQWIEDEEVAVRAIKIWDDLSQLCTFWQPQPKNKQPSSPSY